MAKMQMLKHLRLTFCVKQGWKLRNKFQNYKYFFYEKRFLKQTILIINDSFNNGSITTLWIIMGKSNLNLLSPQRYFSALR